MITLEQRAAIRRLYYAEHWKVGTIATQLGVHHDTVLAAINRASVVTRGGRCRATTLDPYLPFVRDTLAQYPRLRATRLHEMLRHRGYPGSAVQVRRAVRHLRPAPPSAAYLRLATLPGEVAQVDWGSFGTIRIGRGVRALSAFVMVLGYSRAIHAVFTLDFVGDAENLVLVGAQGLGKTMIAKNVVHQAILHGHSALFTTAADLLLDLNGQETARGLDRRLRHYTRPHLLAIDEIGYLSYDAHAADLLFQIITRRYEQKAIVLTTNLAFRDWHTIFPNAACAVGLIDRLTHHSTIVKVTGESYRLREAERAQKARRTAAK